MGGLALLRDVGAYIKAAIGSIPLSSLGGAAVNGPAINRLGFDSCVLHTAGGSATGSPTAQTLDAKLQESEDGSTAWTDITGAAITQITADDSEAQVDVDLSGVKKFIRVVQTVVLTAGTSPEWPVSSIVILGGASQVPA